MDTLKQNKEQLEATVADKLKEAKSLEELKEIATEEGYELSDEKLEGVAGGEGPWICVRDWSCAQKTMDPGPPSL